MNIDAAISPVHDYFSLETIMITAFTILVGFLFIWLARGFASSPKHSSLLRETWQELSNGSLKKEWDDLAPPFNQESPPCRENQTQQQQPQDVVHFCFLVHGHRGLSKDLSYLQTVMQSLAEQERLRILEESGSAQDVIVHNAICNEGQTTDGVAMGGERLKEEMLQVMTEQLSSKSSKRVTISVVGNSLGGIYSRYAIAKLSQSDKLPCKLHFNIFCTTATPHLGISRHTYLPLPRSAENVVAHALGDTGKDLFRLNDLMKTMATSPEFIEPLGSFRKRIAYANAYGTDFPVPAETAAFLSEESTYPHHFSMEEPENDSDDDDCVVVDEGGLVIATLHTPPGHASSCLNQQHEDELVQMSTALDSLGWTKRFVDIRKEVPRIAIPRSFSSSLQKRVSLLSKSSEDLAAAASEEETSSDANEQAMTKSLTELKLQRVVESRDVAKSVKLDANDPYHRLCLPVGHNMMVAFSRSRLSTYMNKGGRPVVDGLAKELVEGIFAWKEEE